MVDHAAAIAINPRYLTRIFAAAQGAKRPGIVEENARLKLGKMGIGRNAS